MRENRPYGLEGGESGSTGLPYPYPLRLCAFAPLRSFLPTAGISSLDLLPTEPYARFPPRVNGQPAIDG